MVSSEIIPIFGISDLRSLVSDSRELVGEVAAWAEALKTFW